MKGIMSESCLETSNFRWVHIRNSRKLTKNKKICFFPFLKYLLVVPLSAIHMPNYDSLRKIFPGKSEGKYSHPWTDTIHAPRQYGEGVCNPFLRSPIHPIPNPFLHAIRPL
jgi:hypothetical protein